MFEFHCYLIPFIIVLSYSYAETGSEKENLQTDLLLLTVATNETDGYFRFMESVHHYNIPVKVLGMNSKWLGGDMDHPGGGYKINLVKDYLTSMFDNVPESHHSRNTLIVFTDSYDAVVTGTANKIAVRFEEMDASVVFSSEVHCWPDASLASSYPMTESPYKYLNSGGYMGYAWELYTLFRDHDIGNEDDDQLYLTKLYLDRDLREKHRMKLDTKAAIFQNLNGASDDVSLRQDETLTDSPVVLINTLFDTAPLVVHGNGPSKLILNSLANYLGGRWHPSTGCTRCRTTPEELSSISLPTEQVPVQESVILMAIFITVKTPFLQEFFEKISNLNYPKNKIHLYLHNPIEQHEGLVNEFLSNFGEEYLSVKRIKPKDSITERAARTFALERCLWKKCGYLFVVDSVAHLDSADVLNGLIKDNKGVVGPMLVRPYKAWSNFWGAIDSAGFYSRSFDYMDIVSNTRRGLWNIPYLTHCYLVNSTLLPNLVHSYEHPDVDPDMAFCSVLRKQGVFMYVDNLEDLGHLIDHEQFSVSNRFNPEFYEMTDNQLDWEKRYIHPDYAKSLLPGAKHQQPCPDVYWFPMVTPKFCSDFIEIMENYGKWSSGSNYDERLTGGYENVPTRDIHMKQVGLNTIWLKFLQLYIRPLQEAVFTGYYHDPPESVMNFVVRYRPDEQPSLRPHHDSSTYTINIALNTPHVDYEGGGCRFIRYNCSVVDTRLGWVLMHPGRLTHYHEGLPVTKGTRYVMISFINP